MQSRTASSLVAAAFRHHGWLSNADTVKTRDYRTHEHQAIKAHLVSRYGQNRLDPPPPVESWPSMDYELLNLVSREFGAEPWLWKGDAYYLEIPWLATFMDDDEPYIVYVKRHIPDAVESSLGPRGLEPHEYNRLARELEAHLRRKYDWMVDMEERHGGSVVYTTDVLKGRFDTLRMAIERAGGEYDQAIVDAVMRNRG